MEIQQIRNATNKIDFGGVTFLLDPWLIKAAWELSLICPRETSGSRIR